MSINLKFLRTISLFGIVFTTILLKPAAASIAPVGQLPDSVEPTHYRLSIKVDPAQTHFSGQSMIDIRINRAIKSFYLHAQDMNIDQLSLIDATGKAYSASADKTEALGVILIKSKSQLAKGKYQLVIDYSAPFNENLQGLHRVKDGDQYYAFSQMEAIYARYAFPSFDEPRFKTPFDLSVTIPQKLTAISNAPEKKSEVIDQHWKRVDFVTSHPMPTYLVALAVGDFDVVTWTDLPPSDVRKRPLALRGIATKGKGNKLKYALENTQSILESLEDYFQIEYPYHKLDILAVPDFAAGAMENPGAITYREQLLLLDDDSSIGQKRSYKSVHAHELAHQWFGNLVTPQWWNDIWLNEAFATWMAATALERYWPDEQWQRQQIRGSKRAMDSDSIPSARKVRNPVADNSDIITAFDGITYSKGGGVLSMVERFMGEENFRLGVQKYLRKYEWKNADAIDFFETIASVLPKQRADKVVKSFRNFVEQAGVPLLTVTQSCDDERTHLKIDQQRYTPLGTIFNEQTLWSVPACFNYSVDGEIKQQCEVIDKQSQNIQLNISGCADWVMPNAEAAGYYRFNFDSNGWKSLIGHLSQLSPQEENAVIDSIDSAFASGQLSVDDLLAVIPATLKSNSWEVMTSGLSTFRSLIEYADESEKTQLRKIAANIYRPSADQLGFKDNTELDKKNPLDANNLRSRLISFMAEDAKDQNYRKQLTEMAVKYIGFNGDGKYHDDAIIAALRSTAMGIAVQDLGEPYIRALLKHLSASTDGTTRSRILSALSATEDPKIAIELVQMALTQALRDNEKSNILFGLVNKKELDTVMWPWLQNNFEQLIANLPTNYQAWIPYLFSNDCLQRSAQRLDSYLQPKLKQLTGADRNFVKVKDYLTQCLAQKAQVKPQLTEYLKRAQ